MTKSKISFEPKLDESGGIGGTVIRGAFWTSLDRWGSRVIRLSIVAVLARLLNRDDFGLVAAAAVFVDYLSTYVGQGLGLAIIQRKELEPEHLNAMFWIVLSVALVLTAGTWFAAPQIAHWLKNEATTSVLRWLSLGLILRALSQVQIALLTRQMRFAPIATINLISAAAGGVCGVLSAMAGWGVWSLVTYQLVDGAVNRIAVWFFLDWKPGLNFKWRHIRELYSFSAYVFLDQQVLFISRRSDEALVAGFLGISELGLYSIAKRVILLLQEVLETPFAQVMIPALSRLQGSVGEMKAFVNRLFALAALPAIFAFGLLFALAPEIIEIIFGKAWIDAVPIVRIMSLGSILFPFTISVYPTILAAGQPAILLILNTISAILGVGLLSGGAKFGIFGISCSLALRQIIMVIFSLYALWRSIPYFKGVPSIIPFVRMALAIIPSLIVGRLMADLLIGFPKIVISMVSVAIIIAVYWMILCKCKEETSKEMVILVKKYVISKLGV